MSISGGKGVIHQQPVSTLRKQPLHVELQLEASIGLEMPHTRGMLCVGATKSHRAAGHHFLVEVTVLRKEHKLEAELFEVGLMLR